MGKSQDNFSLLSGSRETYLSDFGLNDNSQLVIKVLLDGDFCFASGDKKRPKIVTVNDVFSTRGLNDEQIVELIKNKIGVDVRTKEGIEKLNLLFSEAVDFLQDVLYRNVGNDIKSNRNNYFSCELDNTGELGNDVIKFLRETEKGKRVSQTHCRIAKTIYGVNDILENPEIVESEKNAKQLVATTIAPGIQIEDFNMLMNYNQSKCTIVLNGEIINFKLKFRGKEDKSALLKIIYNPEYNGANLIKDPIGMELVCEKQEHISLLFNHFYTTLFGEEIDEMRHKGFDIESMAKNPDLTKGFSEVLRNSKGKRKDSSNKDYMDLKMLGRINGLLVEFRGAIEGHKEEEILKSDEVYYLGKVLLAMIRLDGYITENYIKLVINNFYERYPDMREKLDKHHLLDYLIKPLIRIDRGSRCGIYTSKDRYETMLGTEFYPENFKKIDKSNNSKK